MGRHVFILRDGTQIAEDCEYCRHLETPRWHYYKKSDGEMIHLRKEHLMMVVGGTEDDIVNNKPPTGI